MTVHDEVTGRLIGGAPVYLKTHSMGEYVFDHGWADAAGRAGLRYYPKVLVAVPFTPVEGGRLLVDSSVGLNEASAARRAMAETLVQFCDDSGLSSVHVNFCPEDDVPELEGAGFLKREGYQYRWTNKGGWQSWDDWLAALRSKRRKETRRERRRVSDAGVTVRMLTGDQVTPAIMTTMFQLYSHHLRHYGRWGHQYLSAEFFTLLTDRWRHRLAVTIAQGPGEPETAKIVAGALHIQKNEALYGRYWGAFEEVAGLHFECCYYSAIEYCLDHGLTRFEAGAQGDHKRGRGLDAEVTRSLHHLAHPGLRSAVQEHLAHEREAIGETVDVLRVHTAQRRDSPPLDK